MEALIHGANVLYLFSYLMRDILWLRVLTVLAAICLIAYLYFRPDPLLTAIYWNLLFIALNLYWIVRLLLERRPVPMNEEEAKLYHLAFRTMTPRDMFKLLHLGSWQDHPAGQWFVRRGDAVEKLAIISSGKAGIELEGKAVGELKEGQFIGTIGFVSEDLATADVVARNATRCLSWPSAKLKAFLKRNPELWAAFQRSLSRELIRRLRSSWAQQV